MNTKGTISLLLALMLASALSFVPLYAQDVLRPLVSQTGFTIEEGRPPAQFTDLGDRVLFVGYNPLSEGYSGLWTSDGTQEATSYISDEFKPNWITAVNGSAFYVPVWREWEDGVALAKYPGGEVKMFAPLNVPGKLANADGTLFFELSMLGTEGADLWKSDGTEAGTVPVRAFDAPNELRQLTALGHRLFFEVISYAGFGDYSIVNDELWTSDGTEMGTVRLLDALGRPATHPAQLTAVGATLFFAADDPDQPDLRALWRSDGTPSGTMVVRGGFPAEANFDAFAALGNTLFFSVDDGVHGQELWRSDGTAASTQLVKDLVPGPTGSSPTELTAVGTALFFAADDPTGGGRALWTSNGTSAGTVIVQDGFPADAGFREFTDFSGALYFIASDGVHGRELWKSDGTEENTRMVEDLVPGPTGAFDNNLVGDLTTSAGRLFFSAQVTYNRRNFFSVAPIDNQVAYWPFSEATGTTTAEAGGHGLDGTLQGEPVWTEGYPSFDGALSFDGADDYVSVAADPALDLMSGLTLMAWFKHSSQGGDHATGIEKRRAYRLLAKEQDQAASTWMFDLWNASGTFYRLEAPAPVYNDVWHHVAATYDGHEMKLYVDGEMVGSRAAQGSIRTTGLPLEIGRRDGAKYYAGAVDEVQLYDRVLTDEEIRYVRGALRLQLCFTAAPLRGEAPLTVTFDPACTFKPSEIDVNSRPIDLSYSLDGIAGDFGPASVEHIFLEPGTYTVTMEALYQSYIGVGGSFTRTIEVTGEAPTPTGLVASWPFSEGAGSAAADASGADHTLALLGGTAWTNGPSTTLGSALQFDGQDDFASAGLHPDFDLTSALTLSAWFNPSPSADNATGIDKRQAYRLLVKSGSRARFLFDFWDTGGTFHRITSASSYAYDTWHHVAATYDGSVMKLYVDGEEQAQEAVSGLVRVVETPLELGRRDGLRYYAGSMGEVQLYSRALSAEEVRGLMTGEAMATQATTVETTPPAVMERAQKAMPETYELSGNYPNPFNPATEIRFGLPEAAQVTLVVYDVRGRAVAHLVEGPLEAGYHTVAWQASAMPSGVYLYRLRAGAFTASKTMVLLK